MATTDGLKGLAFGFGRVVVVEERRGGENDGNGGENVAAIERYRERAVLERFGWHCV